MDPPWASGPWDAGYYDTPNQEKKPMSKTFSKCQDCQRMEYIVDGGTVCESCLRHTTQAKVLLSHADSEIETLRTQLAVAREREKQLRERAERAERAENERDELKKDLDWQRQTSEVATQALRHLSRTKEASDGNGC